MKQLHDITATRPTLGDFFDAGRYFAYWDEPTRVLTRDDIQRFAREMREAPLMPQNRGEVRFMYPQRYDWRDPLGEPVQLAGDTQTVMTRLQRTADRLRWQGVGNEGIALTITAVEFNALRQDMAFVRLIEGQRVDRMTFLGVPLVVVPDV